ncbi:unnamed protein product, partial [marine sediment metagenome]
LPKDKNPGWRRSLGWCVLSPFYFKILELGLFTVTNS